MQAGCCIALFSMMLISDHVFNKSIWVLSPCQVRDHNTNAGRHYDAVFFSYDNMMILIVQYAVPYTKNSVVLFRKRLIMQLHIYICKRLSRSFSVISRIILRPPLSTVYTTKPNACSKQIIHHKRRLVNHKLSNNKAATTSKTGYQSFHGASGKRQSAETTYGAIRQRSLINSPASARAAEITFYISLLFPHLKRISSKHC